MSYSHYDRLSALESTFLNLEDGNTHMHIGSVAICQIGPLANEVGGIDIERIFEFVDQALQERPRFQQKLNFVPGTGQPVWIDDDKFNLRYHVRHTRLPAPGDARLLKRLAGRIMSQQLDRVRPLWELWFVEGLEDGRFAIISKVHHSLVGGQGGIDILSALMAPEAARRRRNPREWLPRPPPSSGRLLVDAISRRASLPLSLLRSGSRVLAGAAGRHDSVRDAMEGIVEVATSGFRPADETPLNQSLGPYRRLDWMPVDFDAAREIKNRLGGKINDVVLATTAGAIRTFFGRRGMSVNGLDFRVLVPIDKRGKSEGGISGSHVSSVVVRLPLDEPDPHQRYLRILDATREVKGSKQSLGAETLAEIADLTDSALMGQMAQLGLWSRAANMIVTSVPGSPVPLSVLGAPLLEVYPLVPMGINQALGIGLVSYAGSLYWGFNSDWDALPDLHHLVEATQFEFETLHKAAIGASKA